MSLNWDATKAPNWDKLSPPVKESVIFSTMFVDMGEITEANHREFYTRYVEFNMACGYPDLYLKPGDIRNAIGLHTNVFTTTPAAWRKRVRAKLEQIAEEKARKAFAALEKEGCDA